MKKAIVTKEFLEVIENLRVNYDDQRIFEEWFHFNSIEELKVYVFAPDFLTKVLLGHYEIEKTKEEKILDIYKTIPKNCYTQITVLEILNLLEIKIEGIN